MIAIIKAEKTEAAVYTDKAYKPGSRVVEAPGQAGSTVVEAPGQERQEIERQGLTAEDRLKPKESGQSSCESEDLY